MIKAESQVVTKVEQFTRRLAKRFLTDHVVLDAEFSRTAEPVRFQDRTGLAYSSITEGAEWGTAWDSAWFHLRGTVPETWRGRQVVAQLDFNGEALVFSAQGVPLQGLTNASVFATPANWSGRPLFPLFTNAQGGEKIELWVEAAANGLFGVNRDDDPARDCPARHGQYKGTLNYARLSVFNNDVWQLWLDFEVLVNVLHTQPAKGTRRARILRGLSEAVDIFADNPENAARCRAHLRSLLAQPAHASAPTIHAVGHAHIDTAWLWPVRETVRKAARTFASQLSLLERYPEYVFGASQPQLYAFVKDHYPELYAKIKAAVAAGRWELQGAMWVEADCNIISGESMVRQVIHGKNFYRDEFGVDVRNLWLPDVFGYSASMPQIMKRAGVDYFVTIKMSWSQFNRYPHTTFRWTGIDGSEIVTHFPPEFNYNSFLNPRDLVKSEENFEEKDILDEMLCLFGVGDGGGGPTPEIIERGRRQHDLEGVPKVRFGRADEFLAHVETRRDKLPCWAGELYLELHRGTLTTQGRTKRGNRKLELALQATEYLCALMPLAEYPRETLDSIWKTLLINQFHDIIPGSSIHCVYEQTEREHGESLHACQELQEVAAARMFKPENGCLTAVNILNCATTQPIVLPADWAGGLRRSNGTPVPVQRDADGTLIAAAPLGPQEILTLRSTTQDSIENAHEVDITTELVLENNWVRYEFNRDGQIEKAWDKEAGRNIIPASSKANVLTLYEDRPANWDAWDIDIFYETQILETARATTVESLGKGPVRQGLFFRMTVGQSTLEQKIYLNNDSKRLDFVTEVNWCERHRMLRTAFPVDVRADQASFEIQYGYARRNTHRNVSWDLARFEVAAQRYADLSDNQYGVALLNDCKYGHKIHENVLDLNLLRSPTNPDPDADQGRHVFTYSLLPHLGSLIQSNVRDEAAQLNQPPLLFAGYSSADCRPPVLVGGQGVSLEVLKKAEKSESLVIRLVETRGCRTVAEINLQTPGARLLVETDLLEWNDLATYDQGNINIALEPFEIRTFRLAGR